MARFLFCSYGAVGHVTPLWPVASALRARGHAVGVLTAPAYEAKAAALGLRYFAPRTWEATLDRVQSERAPRDGLEALREMQRVLNEVLVPDGLRQMSDMRDITSSWDVDVVVGTSATFGVSLFAEKEQKVWATHAPLLTCPLPSRDLAPWGTGAQPPRSTVAKARAALLRGAYQMLNSMLSREWGRLRAREGLPAVTKYLTESVFSPFLYMIPSPAEFDFPRSDLPPQVHYVGPCLAGGSSSEGWKNPFTNGDPLVYCTAGTVADPRGLVRTAIEAVRGQRMNLFVTLGPRFSPSELGPLPPNVAAASFVPQHLLLPEASAVVCNGGSGAVMGTLAAGKPLVIVPQLSDQPENAARCAALGAGVVLAEQRLTPALLRAALEHVLATPSYTAAARRMADSLEATNGPGVAAELLERLADVRQPIYRGEEQAPSSGPEMRGIPPEASAGASAGRSPPVEFSQSRVVRIDRALLRDKARMQG